MALSPQVESSLEEATSNLRNALANAARGEHPMVLESISRLLIELQKIQAFDKFHEEIAKLKINDQPNPFF